MMKKISPGDLMIGNIILYGNPVHKNLPTYSITGIMGHTYYLSDGSSVSSNNANINGIPLTEKWLIKLGFEKESNIKSQYSKGLLTINIPDNIHNKGRVYFNSWAILNEQPAFVHQLQNIYQALIGSKLETIED